MHQFLKFILEGNPTCFRQFLCPSSGVFHCTQQWCMSYSLQAGSGCSILILLASCQKNLYDICHTACKQDQDIPSWFCLQAVRKTASRIRMFHPDSACKLSEKPLWHMSYSLQAGSGYSILILLASCQKNCKQDQDVPSWFCLQAVRKTCMTYVIQLASCPQTCMTYAIAECLVKNSCWWTEELSETCRVSFQE